MTTIKSKMIINVCIVFLTIIAIVGLNYFDLKGLGEMQDLGAKRSLDSVEAKEASMQGMALYRIIADAVINRKLAETDKSWSKAKEKAFRYAAAVEKSADTPEEKKLAEEVIGALREIVTLFEGKMLPLLKTTDGRTPELREIDGKIDVQVVAVEEKMDKIVESLSKEMKASDQEFDNNIRYAIILALIIGLIGILLQAGLATWLMRQVLKPVNPSSAVMKL